MVRKNKWLPPETPAAVFEHYPEPGAKHDYMAREYLEGPGNTPLADIYSGVILTLGVVLSLLMFVIIPGVIATGGLWVVIGCAVAFAAGAAFTLQRGIRRWRWRLRNVELTGGVDLKPWQKTPNELRGRGDRI